MNFCPAYPGRKSAELLLNYRLQMRVCRCNRGVRNANRTNENRSVRNGQVELANRRIQPLCHLSAVGPAEKNRPNKTQYSIKSTQGRVRFSRRIFLFG